MAQLAVAMQQMGYQVSGSDKEFYEPMGGVLRRSGVQTFSGYDPNHIPQDVALVVIGNAVTYENPEVRAVESRKLKYTCFPKALQECVIGDRRSVVVSGTHGKTTTSGMIAFTLSQLKLSPSYFIGGVVLDLPESLYIGSGDFSVVEGDEYDSAFFAKTPKFTFYRPQIWIITSVEFDHADIYPSLTAIEQEFSREAAKLTNGDTIIICTDGDSAKKLAREWTQESAARIVTYGTNREAQYRITNRSLSAGVQSVEVDGVSNFKFEIAIAGAHHALNGLATLLAIKELGIGIDEAAVELARFRGVKRRQEVRVADGPVLIEDFAHHPTAVRETLAALREFYPGRKIWAVFEPRSNTSRLKVFFESYLSAFESADQVVMRKVAIREVDDSSEIMNVEELADKISKSGVPTNAFAEAEEIAKFLIREAQSDDLVVVMSNGSFGGLIELLEKAWRR